MHLQYKPPSRMGFVSVRLVLWFEMIGHFIERN
jgi:hypothetical protein